MVFLQKKNVITLINLNCIMNFTPCVIDPNKIAVAMEIGACNGGEDIGPWKSNVALSIKEDDGESHIAVHWTNVKYPFPEERWRGTYFRVIIPIFHVTENY
jgi:hypothetical protein